MKISGIETLLRIFHTKSEMIKINGLFSLVTILISLLFGYIQASAHQASVYPPEINQGDAFLVKITEIGDGENPDATFNKRPLYFSSCGDGCFVAVGVAGIDTKPGPHSVRLTIGGQSSHVSVVVKKAKFPTIHLTLPPGKVFLSPEDQKRANRDAEKLNAIWPVISGKLWEGSFEIPLGNKVSTVFGVKRIMNKKKTSIHRGVDIKGKRGEEVLAFNRGKVVVAEELFYGGNTVVLDHGQGIYSIYMHLSKFHVMPGDIVSKGDVIAFVGSSGRATGPHLHFGVKVRQINTNPLSFLELDL
jgi:hypothetical protein